MEAQDKIKKSAEALGVLLEIPAYVDPNAGFTNEKIVNWENGDSIKISVLWAEGAFVYKAILGQIDPKTNSLAYVTGPIAEAPSLETLVEKIDAFLGVVAAERGVPAVEVSADAEPATELPPEVVEPEVVDAPLDDVPAVVDEPEISADDIVAAYNALNDEYQELLLDPDHDHDAVWEMSEKLKGLEIKLREQGIRPGTLLA